ncbi:multidrug effflux MFS transporter [Paenibacillus albicereus]|uniref:Bcr/CflA family efflux transporter n=2 Tax=Paenibacillus albicereus TaxID=2726185 RepID=A0A6H2H413_9BACL|nr:multidrug effflux MFS transporter [Paenibacillus albicereus]
MGSARNHGREARRISSNPKRGRVRFALLLGLFSALGPFTVDMYLSSLPQLTRTFQSDPTTVQLSLTSCLLGLALGQVFLGPLSDSLGRRRPLAAAMLLYAAASVACASAPDVESFIALRFLQGFVASAGIVISRAIVRDSYSGVELTKFIALLTMIGNVAPLISPVAGSVVTSYAPWTSVFLCLALLGLGLTAVTLLGIKETLPPERRAASGIAGVLGQYRRLIADRSFIGYALVTGILFAGVFAYVAATPFVYQTMYGVSPLLYSVLFALNGGAIMLGSLLVRRLAGQRDEASIVRLGLWTACVSSAAVLLVVLAGGPLYALVAALFAFAMSIGMIGPATFALAMEKQGHRAGQAAALLGILPYLFGSLASPIVGIAGESSALPFGILLLASSLLAALAYAGLAARPRAAAAG